MLEILWLLTILGAFFTVLSFWTAQPAFSGLAAVCFWMAPLMTETVDPILLIIYVFIGLVVVILCGHPNKKYLYVKLK